MDLICRCARKYTKPIKADDDEDDGNNKKRRKAISSKVRRCPRLDACAPGWFKPNDPRYVSATNAACILYSNGM